VSAGIYLTLRGFRASEARANGNGGGGHDSAAANNHVSLHDHPTNEQLKRFFSGKVCAICAKAIPPVQWTGLKPGLYNPQTHETRSWDEIPNGDLSSMLETQKPLCSSCVIAESFRERFSDRVVDRDRPLHDAQPRPLA
jgi:hypothetical protein